MRPGCFGTRLITIRDSRCFDARCSLHSTAVPYISIRQQETLVYSRCVQSIIHPRFKNTARSRRVAPGLGKVPLSLCEARGARVKVAIARKNDRRTWKMSHTEVLTERNSIANSHCRRCRRRAFISHVSMFTFFFIFITEYNKPAENQTGKLQRTESFG